jgi:hypothetical protein
VAKVMGSITKDACVPRASDSQTAQALLDLTAAGQIDDLAATRVERLRGAQRGTDLGYLPELGFRERSACAVMAFRSSPLSRRQYVSGT